MNGTILKDFIESYPLKLILKGTAIERKLIMKIIATELDSDHNRYYITELEILYILQSLQRERMARRPNQLCLYADIGALTENHKIKFPIFLQPVTEEVSEKNQRDPPDFKVT